MSILRNKTIGRIVNPQAASSIKDQSRATASRKVKIRKLQNVNRLLNSPRRGVYLTPNERIVRQSMSRKGKIGGFR